MPAVYPIAAICLLLSSCQIQSVYSWDFRILSSIQYGYYSIKSLVTEICDVTASNVTGLDTALKVNLYGQPFVRDLVSSQINNHLMNNNPQKALVLSFHGSVGGGKNFVGRMIAESIFPKGYSSKFVKLYLNFKRFTHDKDLQKNQIALEKDVVETVKQCERSLFIFDEVDKFPIGLFDVLKAYVDYHPHVDGVDFRKAIFIFISNIGSVSLNDCVLEHRLKNIARDDIHFKELEDILMNSSFRDKGGLQKSSLISSRLVSAFVPFLPLEKKHIKMCIRDILSSSHKHLTVDRGFVNRVADALLYFPAENELFSVSGCKRLVETVNLLYQMETFGKIKTEL